MDPVHLHLILTHFPIVGTIIGVVILAYGIVKNKVEIQKTALVLFVFMSLLTIPVFLTGEEAEEILEKNTNISEQIVEEHEELAEKAIYIMGLLGIMSVFSLYSLKRELNYSKTLIKITLIISLITFVAFAQVGNYGGKISHSEIRSSDNNIKS